MNKILKKRSLGPKLHYFFKEKNYIERQDGFLLADNFVLRDNSSFWQKNGILEAKQC